MWDIMITSAKTDGKKAATNISHALLFVIFVKFD
jgi:hypothetical protein